MIIPKDEYKFAGRMKLLRVPNTPERKKILDDKNKIRMSAMHKVKIIETALNSKRKDKDKRILDAAKSLLVDFDRAKQAEQILCNHDEHYRFKRMAKLGGLKRW